MDLAQIGIYIAYVLLIVAVVAVVAGLLIGLKNDFKSGILGVGGLVVVLIIFLIGYSLASPGSIPNLKPGFAPGSIKMASGGLMTFYVMVAITIGLVIYDILRNIFQGN